MLRLWPISISLEAQSIHIHADRNLAFQVLTAFGAAGPHGDASSRVLERSDGRLLVEFKTPVSGLFGRRKVYRTVEWVTLDEPKRVDFEGTQGPLPVLRDRITLEAQENCTLIHYTSTFGVRGWVPGWIVGQLYVKPMMKRFIRDHLQELKEAIESRARRSRVYPQLPCVAEEAISADVG